MERHISHFYYFVKPKIKLLNYSDSNSPRSARGSAKDAKWYKPSATDTELIQMYASIHENRRFQSAYIEPAPRSSTAEILGYYDLVGVTDMFDETASLLAPAPVADASSAPSAPPPPDEEEVAAQPTRM